MTEEEVWTTDEEENRNKVHIGSTTVPEDGELGAARVKEIAEENGVKKFNVNDGDGNEVPRDDFPFAEDAGADVYIEDYNEAGH